MTEKVFVILVFDVSNKKSFANLEDDFIQSFINNCKNDNRILYIVGNKTDKGARQVTEEEGRTLAENYGYKYFETSAKTGENVEKVFTSALEEVCKNLSANKYGTETKALERVGIKRMT